MKPKNNPNTVSPSQRINSLVSSPRGGRGRTLGGLLLAVSLFISVNAFAQKNVEPVSSANASKNGVIYALPKTALEIQIETKKTTKKAGPFAEYAKSDFGIENTEVVFKDNVTYEILSIKVETKGKPDASRTYKVTADASSKANFLQLDKNGVICGVNAGKEIIVEKEKNNIPETENEENLTFDLSDLDEYYFSSSSEEQREIVSEQIHMLRQSRIDLMTGDVLDIPTDGEVLKVMLEKLNERENVLMELYKGKSATTTMRKTIELTTDTPLKNKLLFYFSSSKGITTDTNANPCYINLIVGKTNTTAEKEKSGKGFYYCVPANVDVEIFIKEKSFYRGNIQMGQFGKTLNLPANFVEKSNASIVFDTTTGAIKSIK